MRKKKIESRRLKTKDEVKAILDWLTENSPYNVKRTNDLENNRNDWFDHQTFDRLIQPHLENDKITLKQPTRFIGEFIDMEEAILFKLVWG